MCMYVCMYVYIYIYIHTHIHTYIYAHTYAFMCVRLRVYVCVCVNTMEERVMYYLSVDGPWQECMYLYIHTYIHTCMYVCGMCPMESYRAYMSTWIGMYACVYDECILFGSRPTTRIRISVVHVCLFVCMYVCVYMMCVHYFGYHQTRRIYIKSCVCIYLYMIHA